MSLVKPFNSIVHFSLHDAHCTEKIVSAHWHVGFCWGGGEWGHPQGAVHIVAARHGCKRAIVGTK